jgi:hypothetical protein
VRFLGQTCEEKLPGSNFDRFFAEEFCKKLKTPEEMEQFMDKFRQTAESSKTEAEFREALEEMVSRPRARRRRRSRWTTGPSRSCQRSAKPSSSTLEPCSTGGS